MQKKDKRPLLIAGVGCLLSGLTLAVVLVSAALPSFTSGRTSWDEAMMGIIPGGICCGLSVGILVFPNIPGLLQRDGTARAADLLPANAVRLR